MVTAVGGVTGGTPGADRPGGDRTSGGDGPRAVGRATAGPGADGR